jgi:hypothetical protein
VLVAGVPAMSVGFNFRSWSALVPIGALASITDPATHTALIEVTALDACGRSTELESPLSVVLDPVPGLDVRELAVAVEYPGNVGFIPANGINAARLTITGSPNAAGATVVLSSPAGGNFMGAATTTAVLQLDAENRTSARVDYASMQPGTNLVEARLSNGSISTTAAVRVSDPPVFHPSDRTLTAGAQLGVAVISEGVLQSCQASPSAGFDVTLGLDDLMAGGIQLDAISSVDLIVAAHSDAMNSTVTVSCTDVFGQIGSATYSVQ